MSNFIKSNKIFELSKLFDKVAGIKLLSSKSRKYKEEFKLRLY